MFCIQIVGFDILIFPFFSPCFSHLAQPEFLTDFIFIVSVEVLSSFVWIWIAFLFLALLQWGGYTWILYAPAHLADRLRIQYTDVFLPRMLPRVILQSSTCREMECFSVKEQAYLAYPVQTGDHTDTMIPLLCECRLPSESLHVTLGGHWALGSLSGCPWLFVMPFINYVNKELPGSSQHLWNIGSQAG